MNLSSYDWIVVSSSAGKDSQALLDVVYQAAAAEGVVDRLVVVHCDLGRVEWQGTRELAERQAERYGLRFLVVRREQGDLLTHVEARGMWPGPGARYCTSDHKRGQVRRIFTKLAAETRERERRQVRILDCQGLRADESPERAKLPAFEFNASASNGRRHVDTWLPIHEWTLPQVWERIGDSRMADLVHPAYALGMPRLSCVFCIFAPKAALMLAGRHNPELLAEYVRIENKIGHKFKANLALADVATELAGGVDAGAVESWRM